MNYSSLDKVIKKTKVKTGVLFFVIVFIFGLNSYAQTANTYGYIKVKKSDKYWTLDPNNNDQLSILSDTPDTEYSAFKWTINGEGKVLLKAKVYEDEARNSNLKYFTNKSYRSLLATGGNLDNGQFTYIDLGNNEFRLRPKVPVQFENGAEHALGYVRWDEANGDIDAAGVTPDENTIFVWEPTGDVDEEIDYLVPVAGQWTKEKINDWYDDLPWLVGCNYNPATAINQIEMWQASTWDPVTIDKELGWAEDMGMNTLRVYLHDLVWEDDEQGLYDRMDQFLTICQNHKIRPFFVFFEDVHYPEPKLGPQPLPVIAWHNSGWVNSPARELALRYADGLATPEEVAKLKGYVQKTIEHFKDDARVLMWELYNEPGRGSGENGDLEGEAGSDTSIREKSNKLVYNSWVWAREINPSQPIMSNSAGSIGGTNRKINEVNSDLQSIHTYKGPEDVRTLILNYQKGGRPVVVTEWLAREKGSTVQAILPVLKDLNAGAINWGLVSGKTGTIWPWSSRTNANGGLNGKRERGEVINPGDPFPEPELWFHDLFRTDGTPFDQEEIDLFISLTSDNNLSMPSRGRDINEFIIYSNPVNDKINLNLNNLSEGEVQLTIYSLFGKKVKNLELKNITNLEEQSIDVKELEVGTYFLTIKSFGLLKTIKFIKQN
ncbi:T9SS type A sorting domain-containing protein [Algibacter amylolyticus]|uniref:T9SS type A sorting domain-containing protein n=1 Tax=Algibacter amylolyticus TaxID=1608400 RepID=A0A5M7B9X8_9FLAO|nr:T9SS type A sorting domain-containing protein [Algibacter amylolyticus]KAA5825128.1 T9SS type A sorting domain-containing protein [Algibacter amylolyticus]MBB5268764.1 hypothetical protein [Algibacter amylolyticus]TSJ77622.1 T9SS type A sorting domain-containing protein [Algibacter amylolyticus]